ncbi:MAG: MDR family oxidoreductase [Pseudomonadota bacterium]
MDPFKALWISQNEDKQTVAWREIKEQDLMPGDVTIRVSHSTINYKDGLAITGNAPVVRSYPMIPGIDLVGEVVKSENENIKPGENVIVTGCGMGEDHFGGYAEYARVKSEWVVPVPEVFSSSQAIAIGTAGFTAMLCVMALQDHDLAPDNGPIVVTGASGGVGSVAVALLAKLGYDVIAATGRTQEKDYLMSLGAKELIDRNDLSGQCKPLAKERWAGGIDVAGSHILANVIAHTQADGVVAACGLAQGLDLPVTVAPFILRGVTLCGVNSVEVPRKKRLRAWQSLAQDLDIAKIDAMTTTYPLSDVIDIAPKILQGQVRGRVVLNVT